VAAQELIQATPLLPGELDQVWGHGIRSWKKLEDLRELLTEALAAMELRHGE
jgi:hypothetical protein